MSHSRPDAFDGASEKPSWCTKPSRLTLSFGHRQTPQQCIWLDLRKMARVSAATLYERFRSYAEQMPDDGRPWCPWDNGNAVDLPPEEEVMEFRGEGGFAYVKSFERFNGREDWRGWSKHAVKDDAEQSHGVASGIVSQSVVEVYRHITFESRAVVLQLLPVQQLLRHLLRLGHGVASGIVS
ncbi:unnamed protein product [Scytosiphon promiscuus]